MLRVTVALCLAACGSLSAQQLARGEALFFEEGKGCATCHALKGKGTAVGPDLKIIAKLSPRAIAMGVRSTVTQYVQNAKLKSTGESFPAMPAGKDDKVTQVYDLSKTPPELKKIDNADLTLMNNDKWKHPPASAGLTNEQMADVVAFIRAAGANIRTPVKPDDIE